MHTNDFNWTLIRSFLAALDRGSLMAAARALTTSQPTVGRHIAELEAQLGVVLFERTGRGLLPTAHAHRLADSARAMATAADQIARQASGAQAETRGTVRISASQPVARELLPAVLLQMRQILPDVQVELVASNAVSNLLQREADIALRMVRPEQASLLCKRIGQIAIGTYAHRDYLRRRGTPRAPEDLAAHDLIGGDRDTDILRTMAAMGHPMRREDFVLRTDDLNVYHAAVATGLGVGFMARYIARQTPDLVPLLPLLDIPALPVWLVVHREIRSNPRIRQVWDFLSRTLPPALA